MRWLCCFCLTAFSHRRWRRIAVEGGHVLAAEDPPWWGCRGFWGTTASTPLLVSCAFLFDCVIFALALIANVKSMFGAIFPRWQALHRGCVTQRSEMVVEGEAVPLDAEQICNCKGQLRLAQDDFGELLDVASQLRNPRRDRADNVARQPGEEKFGNTDENDHRLEQCLRQRQATGKNRNVVSVLMNWVGKREDSTAQDFKPQFVVCHT